jgi:hypothetical protein
MVLDWVVAQLLEYTLLSPSSSTETTGPSSCTQQIYVILYFHSVEISPYSFGKSILILSSNFCLVLQSSGLSLDIHNWDFVQNYVIPIHVAWSVPHSVLHSIYLMISEEDCTIWDSFLSNSVESANLNVSFIDLLSSNVKPLGWEATIHGGTWMRGIPQWQF